MPTRKKFIWHMEGCCKRKVLQQPPCANSDLSHSLPMVTVGGDAYIAPRANVGIGPYEHRINRLINRNSFYKYYYLC